MFDGIFLNENIITNSIINDCEYQDSATSMYNSYINNSPEYIIEGRLENCIVRNGTVGYNSSIDKNTVIIKID
jgi:hypothetical protein